jgi:hypothetical protein
VPKYDLAVVGAGLGGLAAAALASRRNKKTIVLEPGDAVGGALGIFKKNGFVFCPGPTLSFGFVRGGALQRLNESLGITQNASLRSPCYQVALPDRRITVYAEQPETLDELRREFPNEIDRIVKFYHDLRKQSLQNSRSRISAFLSSRKTAAGFIQNYRFSREFTAFLDVQSYYFFQRSAAALPQPALITLCDSRPYTVYSGFRKVAEQMVDVLLKNGGEIRYNVPLAGITLKARGLSTPNGELETAAVLLNTEQHQQRTVVCIGVREEVIPVSMLQEVLCVPDYFNQDRFFTISLSAKDDETAAPRGMRTVTASFPASTQSLKELVQQSSALIPFLSDFLLFAEKCGPASRVYDVPKDISLKILRIPDNQLLSRFSTKGIYMLSDNAGMPAQSIAAAEWFIERM